MGTVSENRLHCKGCAKRFSCRKNLRRHMRRFEQCHKYLEEEELEDKKNKRMNPHPRPTSILDKNKLKKKCNECDYLPKKASSLSMHIKSVHKKIKDIQCNQCNFSTALKSSLRRHNKSYHGGIKDLRCPKCPYETAITSNFNRHRRVNHPNETDLLSIAMKMKKCDECDYTPNKPRSLILHVKSVHRKIKDIQCSQCEYQTSLKSSLRRHQKSFHSDVQDIICDECPYRTAIQSNFTLHKRNNHPTDVDLVQNSIKMKKCEECDYMPKPPISLMLIDEEFIYHLQA